MEFRAVDLPGAGPLFFVLNRAADARGATFVPTYKSKTTACAARTVQWEPVHMLAGTICRDDQERPVRM